MRPRLLASLLVHDDPGSWQETAGPVVIAYSRASDALIAKLHLQTCEQRSNARHLCAIGGGCEAQVAPRQRERRGAFGYFSFFNTPSTFFDPIRGGGSLMFYSNTQFASFSSPRVIGASINPFIIALVDTRADGVHYGYGQFAGTSLVSYGFESVAGQAIAISNASLSAVPLPPAAPMFGAAPLQVAGLGYVVRRRKAAAAP